MVLHLLSGVAVMAALILRICRAAAALPRAQLRAQPLSHLLLAWLWLLLFIIFTHRMMCRRCPPQWRQVHRLRAEGLAAAVVVVAPLASLAMVMQGAGDGALPFCTARILGVYLQRKRI